MWGVPEILSPESTFGEPPCAHSFDHASIHFARLCLSAASTNLFAIQPHQPERCSREASPSTSRPPWPCGPQGVGPVGCSPLPVPFLGSWVFLLCSSSSTLFLPVCASLFARPPGLAAPSVQVSLPSSTRLVPLGPFGSPCQSSLPWVWCFIQPPVLRLSQPAHPLPKGRQGAFISVPPNPAPGTWRSSELCIE